MRRLLNLADGERAAVMFGASPEVGQAAPARAVGDADAIVGDLEDERVGGRLHGDIDAAGAWRGGRRWSVLPAVPR